MVNNTLTDKATLPGPQVCVVCVCVCVCVFICVFVHINLTLPVTHIWCVCVCASLAHNITIVRLLCCRHLPTNPTYVMRVCLSMNVRVSVHLSHITSPSYAYSVAGTPWRTRCSRPGWTRRRCWRTWTSRSSRPKRQHRCPWAKRPDRTKGRFFLFLIPIVSCIRYLFFWLLFWDKFPWR
jgi:hypothetical protein